MQFSRGVNILLVSKKQKYIFILVINLNRKNIHGIENKLMMAKDFPFPHYY